MSHTCKNCNKEIENYVNDENCPHCGFDDIEELVIEPE